MSFTYYPPNPDFPGIHPGDLRYRYYVQVGPDGRLVPGVLHQGKRPGRGTWLEISRINRPLPEHYYVKTAPRRRLVPGSLVQSERQPEGPWKEVRKSRRTILHRAVFSDNYELTVPPPPTGQLLATVAEFNTNRVLPVLQTAFPDKDFIANPVRYRFYYFLGDFEALDNTLSRLLLFPPGNALFTMSYFIGSSEYLDNSSFTNNVGPGNLKVTYLAGANTYSWAIGLISPTNQVTDYIFFENLVKILPL